MQSEQYNNQSKQLRSDSRSSGESNTTSAPYCDAALDRITINKRDTINNLINTLQLIRDSDESAIAPATMDALNSMARQYGIPNSSVPTTTSTLSSNSIADMQMSTTPQVPALQAVPYIVPQQKADYPSWSENRPHSLQSPQLFQQQAISNPYAITTPPTLDAMNATSPLRGVAAFSIFPLNPPPKDETSQELLGSAATAPTSLNAKMEFAQRQKNKAIQKLKMAYGPQANFSQVQSIRGATPVTPLPKFPSVQAYTAPAATRARKADFPAPGEPTAIRKVPQYARSHGLNKTTQQPASAYSSQMLISKAQLLSNQHLEPLYDEKATTSSQLKMLMEQPATPNQSFNYCAPTAPAAATSVIVPNESQSSRESSRPQATTERKQKRQREQVVVDSSVRECNEWSIYSVPLPTQLHVKCHCFSADS